MPITAECTWGDGPDVLLNLGEELIDLTADEAVELSEKLTAKANEILSLGGQLMRSAQQARNNEAVCREHDLLMELDRFTNPY